MALVEGQSRTLVGRVVAEHAGPVLARARLGVGKETHRRELGEPLTLELDDGERVTIEVAPKDVLVAPEVELERPWGELADSRLAQLFTDQAPGEHVEVELAGWRIDPGARLAVRAEVTGSSLFARAIAIVDGDDATALARLAELERDLAEREARKLAELDRRIEARQREPNGKRKRRRDRQRRVPRPWKYAAPVLAVIGLGLGALAFAIDPDRAEVTRAASEAGIRILLAGGALVVSVALAMWLSRPPFEAEDTHDGATARHPTWAIGKVSFWAIFVGAMVVLPTSFAPRVAAIGFAYVALVGLGILGWCLHRHRRRLRLARLLLVARDRTGRDGYGRFEAIVQSNTKQVAGRTVDYVQKSRSYQETVRAQDGTWTTRTATDYWLEARPSSTGLGHLVLRSDDETVTIGGKRALWGAPLAWQPTKQDTRFRSEARISDGDHVVVLGRVELEDERPIIRANGKEALVMFGAREAPRRTLAVLTLNWVANATLLVGISAACLGYALHLVTHSAPTTPASAPYRGPAEQP